jgi:hypothetical protein
MSRPTNNINKVIMFEFLPFVFCQQLTPQLSYPACHSQNRVRGKEMGEIAFGNLEGMVEEGYGTLKGGRR